MGKGTEGEKACEGIGEMERPFASYDSHGSVCVAAILAADRMFHRPVPATYRMPAGSWTKYRMSCCILGSQATPVGAFTDRALIVRLTATLPFITGIAFAHNS
ncbi:unnamed protein product [Toxocara canis]|uniref:Peptidase_S8 domain-containing protein n=1 Tax=Toxocara canis TaxID=6265 RepID=A0A183V812_TOXCA|nr:unnamed protein product [Toxocara canis]